MPPWRSMFLSGRWKTASSMSRSAPWSIPCCRSTTSSGSLSTPSRATSARSCTPARSRRSALRSARATRSKRSTPIATSTVCGKRDSSFKNPVPFEHRIFCINVTSSQKNALSWGMIKPQSRNKKEVANMKIKLKSQKYGIFNIKGRNNKCLKLKKNIIMVQVEEKML